MERGRRLVTVNGLVIRERQESDTEKLVQLAALVHDLDAYPPYLPSGDYRAFLFEHETLGAWVAEVDGDIVGQVALHPHTGPKAMGLATKFLEVPAERLGVIARLFVSPEHRRQGVAGELLFAAGRAAVGVGLVPMLDVAARSGAAVALYERSGWLQAGAVTHELPNGPLQEYVYVAPTWLRPATIADGRCLHRRWDGPGVEAWDPWSPQKLTTRLVGSGAHWSVVGGWAVDLAAGRVTRQHEDLELATISSDLRSVYQALTPLVPHPVGDGQVWRLGEQETPPAGWHQAWMLDETIDRWRVDVMVEPGDSDRWVYRRDGRITAQRDEMIGRTSSGIPYLRPHGALLYKAARPRPKDESDFTIAAPHLRAAERRWLTEALAMAYPGHPWIRRLGNS